MNIKYEKLISRDSGEQKLVNIYIRTSMNAIRTNVELSEKFVKERR